MKSYLYFAIALTFVMSGCRMLEEPQVSTETTAYTQAANEEDTVQISIEAHKDSIPIGSSFPIIVTVTNGPPNQDVRFEFSGDGIRPSLNELNRTLDNYGGTTFQLSGSADTRQLNILSVEMYVSDDQSFTQTLYVNFEPAGSTMDKQTSAGVPTTFVEYLDSFPEVDSIEGMENVLSDGASGVVVKGVRFPGDTTPEAELQDFVVYNAGWQDIDVGETALKAQNACAIANTTVNLKIWVGNGHYPMPTGTKVLISGSGNIPDQTRYVQAAGKLTFQTGCTPFIHLQPQAWTPNGMYIHSPRPYIVTWSIGLRPLQGQGSDLSASELMNRNVHVSNPSTPVSIRNSHRVWYKVNRVYNWERSAHSEYNTFPLSTVYPDGNPVVTRSRAHYGRMYLEEADGKDDGAIYHEFGHEVYYRRMLGATWYNYFHQQAVNTGNSSFPPCIGYVFAGSYWGNTEGCVAMLEGFAMWFEAVALSSVHHQIEDAENVEAPAKLGWSVPGRVRNFLWDITDLPTNSAPIRDGDGDEVVGSGTANARYKTVAGYFKNRAINIDFPIAYRELIKPQIPTNMRGKYCDVLNRNTIQCF